MNLYCFDGSNLAFRAHCAFPSLSIPLEDEEQFPVGAIYGVVRILDTFFKEWEPGRVIIPFDVSKSTYRLGIFPEYKAGRREGKQERMYSDYTRQLDLIIHLLGLCGLQTISEEARGYEADDVLAFLVSQFHAGAFPGIHQVVLISSDKDLCALVSHGVVWYDPVRHNLVNSKNFHEQFGVEITQYPDFKALKGDQSDNISGVPGIGPKRAAELLTEYGSIDKLLSIQHQKIVPHIELLDRCRKLVALKLHELEPDSPVWAAVLRRLQESVGQSEELYDTLTLLRFESILAEWVEWKARWRRFSEASGYRAAVPACTGS